MKPGDPLNLKDVLNPKPGPLVSTVAPVEPPVPTVVRDDFGFLGEANVVATAINLAAGRGRQRFPRWAQVTAYIMAVCILAPIVLSFF